MNLKEYNDWLAKRGGPTVSFSDLRNALGCGHAPLSPAGLKNAERIRRAAALILRTPPGNTLSGRQQRSARIACRACRWYGLGTMIKKRGYAVKWIPTVKKLPKGWRAPVVVISA